jgi:hypothetical protein
MTSDISRRHFVERAAMFLAAMPAAVRTRGWTRAGPTVRIAVVDLAGAPTDARQMGLVLGAEEANHAALLFGGTLELVPLSADEIRAKGISAIIGNDDCTRVASVGDSARTAGIPIFNVGCGADDLRGAHCERTLFHIAPSDAMGRDAVVAAQAAGTPMAWHPSLRRFGADTLNGRFVARFGHPMTSDAWTAWLATKIIWESALRMSSADPAALIAFLGRDSTQFDGHKGLPLSFRSWDRQLRQPLYVVDGTRVVEVPAGAPTESPRTLLDRFGAQSSTSECHLP